SLRSLNPLFSGRPATQRPYATAAKLTGVTRLSPWIELSASRQYTYQLRSGFQKPPSAIGRLKAEIPVVQYDLSATRIARSNLPMRPPAEADLPAVFSGLMLRSTCVFGELRERPLVLTRKNYRDVAGVIAGAAPPLARDFGKPTQLRQRLRDLVGLAISAP